MNSVFYRLTLTTLVALTATTGTILAGSPYPDPNPPGLKPTLFAPGYISTPDHSERDLALSADHSEIYFSRDGKIQVVTRTGDTWSEPSPLPFACDCTEMEPFLTNDSKRLYFISQRPLEGDQLDDFQLWMVERDDDGWGAPERLSGEIDFYPSLTATGVMYFTDHNNDLYRTRLDNGRMTAREKLSDSINTPRGEYNSYIAPDESYLLFTSHGWTDRPNSGDLFVSFRNDDGSWTRAKNLGWGINSGRLDYCPSLSPDGKYLFFSRRAGAVENIYWVDASRIELVRTRDLDFAGQLLDLVKTTDAAGFVEGFDQLAAEAAPFCDFDADLLNYLGNLLFLEGNQTKAEFVLELSRERFPEGQDWTQALTFALIRNDTAGFEQIAADLLANDSLNRTHEIAVNRIGYTFLMTDHQPEALRVFALNRKLFPESGNVYDSYGEALLAGGDTAGAVASYQKALELDSTNANAAKVLESLAP